MNRDNRELKRVTPFDVRVDVAFTPDKSRSGYNISASAIALVGDNRLIVTARPQLTFMTAHWFCSLNFGVSIDADAVVPVVNKANKD